jgi:hypothetical protein
MFWNYVREKVKSIEDINIKLAFKDEIERRIKVFRGHAGNNFNKRISRNYINSNLSFSKTKLPKTGVEIKIGAIIYMMIVYPKICINYDENISMLDFKKSDLNILKDLILKLVSNNPKISSKDLKQEIINKGFATQISKYMRSNYPSRLNLDEKKLSFENVNKTFKELLNLLGTNPV